MALVGTAGRAIPGQYKADFPQKGTHLERYAARLHGVEINSSFYRPHQRKTYERWAASVPAGFRFSVKVPGSITQNHRLKNYGGLLESFLDEVSGLGKKLDVFLVQLPPSLAYDARSAGAFFRELARIKVRIACEPRHASWFSAKVDKALRQMQVARVAADPPRAPEGDEPGGDSRWAYWRMHGSPKIYYSDYATAALKALAPKLRKNDWCVFDNTSASHALGNALAAAKLTNLITSSALG